MEITNQSINQCPTLKETAGRLYTPGGGSTKLMTLLPGTKQWRWEESREEKREEKINEYKKEIERNTNRYRNTNTANKESYWIRIKSHTKNRWFAYNTFRCIKSCANSTNRSWINNNNFKHKEKERI